jgi:hypothetical protein
MVSFWKWWVRLPALAFALVSAGGSGYGTWEWSLGFSGLLLGVIVAQTASYLGARAAERKARKTAKSAIVPLHPAGMGRLRGQRTATALPRDRAA